MRLNCRRLLGLAAFLALLAIAPGLSQAAIEPVPIGPGTTYLEDYRKVDGLLLPHRSRVVIMGMERVMSFDRIKHNLDLPDDRSDPPAAIRALLEDGKAEKADSSKG